ncbi:MAG: hypothetical protein F6K56_04795 [Moorea sp. SIO3G5]|nr:hypothetical protein [Moorena sp. SIO3G5]
MLITFDAVVHGGSPKTAPVVAHGCGLCAEHRDSPLETLRERTAVRPVGTLMTVLPRCIAFATDH